MTALPAYLLRGALAGAAGTTALNAATFADMALRARPASSTPEQTVERGAEIVGLPLPDDPDRRQARESGLGSLLGAAVGVGAGAALGAMRGLTGHPRGTLGTLGTAWLLVMLTGLTAGLAEQSISAIGKLGAAAARPVDLVAFGAPGEVFR